MKNSNHTGTRTNMTSIKRIYEYCDPETETEKLYHFYVQLLQTWKAFHQLNDHIKINKIDAPARVLTFLNAAVKITTFNPWIKHRTKHHACANADDMETSV
jgi:fumarate reductase subunit D